MQKNKLKLIAAGLVTVIGLAGVSQIASAQITAAQGSAAKPGKVSAVQAQAKPAADLPEAGDTADVPGAAELADPAEAGDTPDMTGAADAPEVGDVADTAEPAGGADTDTAQDGDQGGPETPDAPSSK